MDGHNEQQQQPERLEDQLRRMMLANGPTAPQNQARPTVRLPPQGPNSNPQQRRTPTPTTQIAQVATNGYNNPHATGPPQHGTVPPHMLPGQASNARFAPHLRQNQRERRMQNPGLPPAPGPGPSLAPGTHGPHQNSNAPHRPAQPRQPQIDPNAFQRGGRTAGYYQQATAPRQLFNPNAHGPAPMIQPDYRHKQTQYLEQAVAKELPNVEMSNAERDEKEAFRAALQSIIHDTCAADPERLPIVSLECFGSLKSGFASAGSDMDLVIVLQDGTPYTACFSLLEDDLPRALEGRLLQLGYGARLLTRTRVPIIKICEKPDTCLLDKLRQERDTWDVLPNEKKYPHLHQDGDEEGVAGGRVDAAEAAEAEPAPNATGPTAVPATDGVPEPLSGAHLPNGRPDINPKDGHATQKSAEGAEPTGGIDGLPDKQRRAPPKPWTRERKAGPLDFPKSGIGIQCDINFFNPLGLHNTQMLRCYSLCDHRVRPMVLFVKAWAKQRKINSSYSGTLSSYGYVLMVLHYLMNVAQPPVLPNLQLPWRPNAQCTPHAATRTQVDEWIVDFWRNEEEITKAVQSGQMSASRESLGSLLAGFFQYYSSQGGQRQFHWMQEVLSLRSPGGLLSKEEKGWVKAVTEEGEGKKVQHRYLFCIEDPFELAHNVARTVTHMGIVAIRDEFRRANRILHAIGIGQQPRDGELFAQLVEVEDLEKATEALKLDGAANSVTDGQNTSNNIDDPNARNQRRFAQNRNMHTNGVRPGPPPASKSLDVADKESFPALGGAAKAKKNGHKQDADGDVANTSEISGDRAKAYLEELKMKKADAHAELTATAAAEAVLGGE
ncbi:hypothetical protein LTR36_007028 [Oleoguttula mirabilis]|uniref:polynucleotide adenylyltransferase n=1 Tax=Oleoguttula mirabilis TaxID=1507867 RepID=A0AAV9JBK6_9PEZI|nr:hypothetical protein LTR36_007028 [Oleoguttula mirabilis]